MNYFTLYNMYRREPRHSVNVSTISMLDDEKDWRPYVMNEVLVAILEAYS